MPTSIEDALFGEAAPYTLAAEETGVVRSEISNACLPDILEQAADPKPVQRPALGRADHTKGNVLYRQAWRRGVVRRRAVHTGAFGLGMLRTRA